MSNVAPLQGRRPRPGMALSARELQVLSVLSTGASYEEIAARLFISVDTVKSHLKRIFVKLGAKTGAHAVGLGYELRILTPRGDDAA